MNFFNVFRYSRLVRAGGFFIVLTLLVMGIHSYGHAFTLKVTDANGSPVTNFRWLLQEDTTYHVIPGKPDGNTLSVHFHSSNAPVVSTGDEAQAANITLPDPNKYYFVSVLPDSGYSMNGAPVRPGQQQVTIKVNKLPIPTAQITVFVFDDSKPVNNIPDIPGEVGLEGFVVQLFEAGGKFGISGGMVMQDVFGNPLGTTYNPDGSVKKMGTGIIKTGPDGYANIKNIAPGKYGIIVVPPLGQGWHQTSTIEGTKTIDAWVKANEPEYFMEFGPPGPHVFIGFVKEVNKLPASTGAGANGTIAGHVVFTHNSRPPIYTFYDGPPVPQCWVALNDLTVGRGEALYVGACDENSNFEIKNIPPGTYQLVIWDENLDAIFGLTQVTVPPGGGPVDIDGDGDPTYNTVRLFRWFGSLENVVFYDHNQNGFRDCITPSCKDPTLDDVGIPQQNINIRFRDGSIYQAMTTDIFGEAPFEEVFPFFSWLVAEVDFGRFKATGVTAIVDAGGEIPQDNGWQMPSGDKLNPQPQSAPDGTPLINPNTGNNLARTETGPVLTQAFQLYMGQTNVIQWGKAEYAPGENGGISGMVIYAVTRAENDPRYAIAEPWEPGIPRVQVNLYEDLDGDGVIDDINKDGKVTLADVDNYPFGWANGGAKGPEDIDRNGDGKFDLGDAIKYTTTDSWDDSVPTGCQGEPFSAHGVSTDCFDGLRNFNQIRLGVFDGGYAFDGLQQGIYIVEAVPPPGYELLKEEDKNVDFGETYIPATEALPPVCVGDPHTVPLKMSLFPTLDAPFAGETRPLCDRKQIRLSDGQNSAADFFMFTQVPIAGQFVGFILDDFANEFDPNSPNFGEKYAPPWLPVSIRDWTGREIARTYSDEWGRYNALIPSTFTANLPMPSGYSPNMLTVCLNSPGPIPNPNWDPNVPNSPEFITDPFFQRQYSQFCYTFQYMPGSTTYLDTPVVPVAAFAGPNQDMLDCEVPDGMPKIYSVSGPQGGPYVTGPGETLTIVSVGSVEVPNPDYDGPNGIKPKTTTRDFSFGSIPGTVTIGGTPLENVVWTPDVITGTVAPGTESGELVVTRGDNDLSTLLGVTVTVGQANVIHVSPTTDPSATPIQDAIDLAQPGDLILVAPGNYEEAVIMWKPVRLQGWGAGSTIINAVKAPSEKLQVWRDKIRNLVDTRTVDLMPGQEANIVGIEPALLGTEEGAPITVVAKRGAFPVGNGHARIDGFTITGSDSGGGIFVNGYAHGLEISNNRIVNNYGFYGGGIRVGHPYLIGRNTLVDPQQGNDENAIEAEGTELYIDGTNNSIYIHNNHIAENGGILGAGGGITICAGTKNYLITANFICGNYSAGHGGGIAHYGISAGGIIYRNVIAFNQSFNQGQDVSGGGILIAGLAPNPNKGKLSLGSGSVLVANNLIQGNLAGAGDGGGIRIQFANGEDVAQNPNDFNKWYEVNIVNNVIVNNVAGNAGGAISMQDSVKVNIINNTIANNDSTGTARTAQNTLLNFEFRPAGIVSYAHSLNLASAFDRNDPMIQWFRDFSNPILLNNIIWHNRSFHWDVALNGGIGGLVPDMATQSPVYWDLGVMGASFPAMLSPFWCLLTDVTGLDPSNISADPLFIREYVNGSPGGVSQYVYGENQVQMATSVAVDEGGNFIDVRFAPLTLWHPTLKGGKTLGDYHIQPGSPAVGAGTDIPLWHQYLNDITRFALSTDFDTEERPNNIGVDIGFDELWP
ncbi:hypothetical protein DBT_2352 [Dissulfuribacter thermophilus]|uniref:Uncharacterized protein n=1 Tax=Dissulfuribacter thermophilus TaxID=1156395 RepID=A0A1B9F2Y4_9BACT|nr:hypothetical protein [Dissulfuribacter thermophilus]OCC14280.1 hypothetical protein DBT_2352 [Dissulfuribacter thermophilus]